MRALLWSAACPVLPAAHARAGQDRPHSERRFVAQGGSRHNELVETKGQVLLVNPWIYDFAAFNLWVEPLGMLTIAAVLQDKASKPPLSTVWRPTPAHHALGPMAPASS